MNLNNRQKLPQKIQVQLRISSMQNIPTNQNQVKPLLPYHQYINKNRVDDTNNKLQNNYSYRPPSSDQYLYSNNSYRNFQNNPYPYKNPCSTANYYNVPAYNSYSTLPTYQQFKMLNCNQQNSTQPQKDNNTNGVQKFSKQQGFNKKSNDNDTFNKNKSIENREYNEEPRDYKRINDKNQNSYGLSKKQKQQPIREKKEVIKPDRQLLGLSDENNSQSQFQEDQQIFYQKIYVNQNKTKQIHKKKDTINDSPEQIKKWIQMRKKNYPRKFTQKKQNKEQNDTFNDQQKKQMSKLQSKIRKKIQIINGDTRNLLKKLRNIDILRRIVSNPKTLQKKVKKQDKNYMTKQKIRNKAITIKKNLVVPIQQQQIQSIQPIEQVATKIQQNMQNQDAKNNILFQFSQNKIKTISSKGEQKQSKKDTQRSGEPNEIISHLQQKQKQDKEWLKTLFDYKSNSHNYRYKIQTLQVNFKLEQIFQETSHLLQAIRYIVKENFFQQLSSTQ